MFTRNRAGWAGLVCLLTIGLAASHAQSLKVFTMPSNSESPTYANAYIGSTNTIWGRVEGGTGPYTYTLDLGDGTSISGTVTNIAFIGTNVVYSTAGNKTIELTVIDSGSTTNSSQSIVRVFPTATKSIKVNIAIERGLLYMYKNQDAAGSWYQVSDYYTMGQSAFTLLAFEENGHLASKTNTDIYADCVGRGLTWILTNSAAGTYDISTPHSDGIAVRDSDLNGNGLGAHLFGHSPAHHDTYANSAAFLALAASCRNAVAASNTIVSGGPFDGWSYHDVMQDGIELMMYCQGDGTYRGTWVYDLLTTQSGTRWDGSAQQWPVLCFEGAKAWGITTPDWVRVNVTNGFGAIQNANGGIGYSSSSSSLNIGKTGGGISAFHWAGMTSADAPVSNALAYIRTNYNASAYSPGWAGALYHMYGMKKGLSYIDGGIDVIDTPSGPRNWSDDFSAFLLGDAASLPAGLSYPTTLAAGFGQYPDGHWSSAQWPTSGSGYTFLQTAWSILLLTKGVLIPPPVAQIAPVGSQPPSTSFELDGSGSYHMDGALSLVEYLWDFDASDGIDWDNPDATGLRPTNPGYTSLGDYMVTLRVRDNGTPEQTDTETITVSVTMSNHAPVAVAIPMALLPGYAGRPGDPIFLDGRSSYDPDSAYGDYIVSYSWDLDGNGTYGDATGPTTSVSFASEQAGTIGLRVTDTGGLTSVNIAYIDIVSSYTDIGVSSFTATRPSETQAQVQVTFENDPSSSNGVTDVLVRFYDGNPFATGTPLGTSFTVTLAPGESLTSNLLVDVAADITELYVWLDAGQVVPEFNEVNNLANTAVPAAPGGVIDLPDEDYDGDGLSDLALHDAASGKIVFLASASGNQWITTLGRPQWLPATADYDGDGLTDPGWFYPTTGQWRREASGSDYAEMLPRVTFGWSEVLPVPADYDGDGMADIAVYWPASGTWFIRYSGGGFYQKSFGWSETIPVPADYDGDRRADIAVFWPATGQWFIQQSTDGFRAQSFGFNGTVPVQGDYDGDGSADISVYWPAQGTWYHLFSGGGFLSKAFGWSAAVPVPADYDGDDVIDRCVYWPGGTTWFIDQSNLGFRQSAFGWSGATPVLHQYQLNRWYGLLR